MFQTLICPSSGACYCAV